MNPIEKTKCSCYDYMASEPLKIQTTNAQEIFNHLQFFDGHQFLIIDFRTRESFENYHVKDSLNVPLEECTAEELISLDENTFINKFCLTKHHKTLFKARRRALIVLIPFDGASANLLLDLPSLFHHGSNVDSHQSVSSLDHASLKNAILMQKFLVSSKHRHTYLSKTGMKEVSEKYPFMCLGKEIPLLR